MTTLFIDTCTYKPYSKSVLDTEPLGGSEASLVRVAEGLNSQVEQAKREVSEGRYHPLGTCTGPFDHVVCFRVPAPLPELRRRFPNAKLWLWAEDVASPEWARELLSAASEVGLSGLIAVSQWHREQCLTQLKAIGYDASSRFTVRHIHNPIDDTLLPDSTPVDPNKLIWLASPHKGLQHALGLFEALRRFNPAFTLYIANPGYCPTGDVEWPTGTVILGPQTHADAMVGVRSSLCLFSPNPVFPETFGNIYAESNAVGTPCLAHGIGAVSEVVDSPYHEVVNCHNPKAVVERVMSWHAGNRPTVRCNPKFRTRRVLEQWKAVLRG